MVYNFSTVSGRIKLYNDVRELMGMHHQHQKVHACFEKKKNDFDRSVRILKRIGKESVNGEAFLLCKLRCDHGKACTCVKDDPVISLKKTPINKHAAKYANDQLSKDALSKSDSWVEAAVMRMCRELVFNRVCPNLPVMIYISECDKCKFRNTELANDQGNPCVNMISEYADMGDFKTWMSTKRPTKYWWNAYFQIFVGLYALQSKFNVTHNDLHYKNVLVHKVPRGGFWRYIINGDVYDVPNYGFLFVLWDFGYARTPGNKDLISNDKWKTHFEESDKTKDPFVADYWKISSMAMIAKQDHPKVKISKDITYEFLETIGEAANKHKKIDLLIKELWSDMYKTSPWNSILETYNLDKKITLNDPELQRFLVNESR